MGDMKITDGETVLRIDNLSKEYKMFKRKKDRLLETIIPAYKNHDSFVALKDFNLELKKGEILGILGRNGAGKSTLLKMITGVVTPTSGTIQKNGKISSLLELGTAFNSELTGEENIYQHGQVFGLTRQEIESKKQDNTGRKTGEKVQKRKKSKKLVKKACKVGQCMVLYLSAKR